MPTSVSFKDILTEKIRGSTSNTQAATHFQEASSAWTHGTDPAHMAFLMSQMGRHQFPRNKSTYKTASHDSRTSQNSRHSHHSQAQRPQPAVLRPSHDLTSDQRHSLEALQTYCPELQDTFTEVELKKAFRQGALKAHPDHGGSATSFRELKEHYSRLRNVFAVPEQGTK